VSSAPSHHPLASPDGVERIRALLEKHLTRESERAAALDFLDTLRHATPTQSAMTGNQNGMSQQ
jgi:hypothetical protein